MCIDRCERAAREPGVHGQGAVMAQVCFIGAGPGDPELLTVKGRRLIGEADLVLYAGSLVPAEVVSAVKPGAKVVDSAPLNLEETHALMLGTVRKGGTVARVHTGDPSLFGAIREQMALLDRDGVSYAVVPGVTAGFAAAAAAARSYTVPEVTQTLIFTRIAGKTPVPEREALRKLAGHGSAMCIYLSAGDPEGVQEELLAGGLAASTLVVMAYRVGWPDEKVVETVLGRLAETARERDFTRQTVFLILPGQGAEDAGAAKSLLYDENFKHMYRKQERPWKSCRYRLITAKKCSISPTPCARLSMKTAGLTARCCCIAPIPPGPSRSMRELIRTWSATSR
eukprot:TRINITY_DN65809_c0_g1_i1.p1 TRINITY_DN65809_c0_g1~~TRINITY_DN65809_c0_g1_i1.p1  ORF type:complete len:340 (-),score=59.71 TRINITY_DN65809_c0_g1_i1:583-1602(-)